jgi:hypothetical protein
MPSSRPIPQVYLWCRRGCGQGVNAANAYSWDIACPDYGRACILKHQLRAHHRRRRLLQWGWLVAVLGILILVANGKSILDAVLSVVAKVLGVVSIGLISIACGLLCAGLVAWFFWICGHFGLPSRLAAGIASLWALLCALLREGASMLIAGPWWPRGGEDFQEEVVGPRAPPSGGSTERLAESLRFQSDQNFVRPEMRPTGAGDTPIAAAIAYVQFKKWDMSLINRALADLPGAHDALDDLLLYALLGSLQIWGRTSRDFDWQPVEQSYWREHDIDRLSVLKREKPFTKHSGGGSGYTGAEVYIDLRTSRSQLEAIWPPQAANV